MSITALGERRRLGRTGMQVSTLGLGGAYVGHLGGGQFSDDLAIATVLRAFELGINIVDTSPMYGESQRRIGLGLRAWFGQGGRREELVISTKAGRGADLAQDYTADGFKRSAQESLRLLGVDYLDILHVHDPTDLEPVFAPGGALEGLLALKQEGVIRAIGLGCRPHAFHRRCIESGSFDVSLTFLDYNLLDQSAGDGVLAPAACHDVGVFNAAAVYLGLLGGEDPRTVLARSHLPASPNQQALAIQLWDWAQERGVSLLALNLQFCLRDWRIGSVLVGCADPAQVEADVAAVGEVAPAGIWDELTDRFGIVMPGVENE